MTKNKKHNDTHTEQPVEETQKEDIAEEKEPLVEIDQEKEDLKAENQKLKDDYLRAFAEAENTKKRCQQEIEKNNKYAIATFAKELLGVADNLQRAIEAVEKDGNKENNCVENLEWCDRSYNIRHALEIGLKVTIKDLVNEIDRLNKRVERLENMANCYKVGGEG